MTRNEWKNVFDAVWNRARGDYQRAICNSDEEKVSFMMMNFARYISDAIKDLKD